MDMTLEEMQSYLAASAARHRHLCPRQVLGVRIGAAGAAWLGLKVPCQDKCLLAILETDGCFADGIEAVTGCSIGHRTLRIEDFGKIAATFVNTRSGQAVRVAPRLDIRETAWQFAPEETRRYYAQLQAYQSMPEADLLIFQAVDLKQPVAQIISRPGIRTCCASCGEEVSNERELVWNGITLCRHCAGFGYYEMEENSTYAVDIKHFESVP